MATPADLRVVYANAIAATKAAEEAVIEARRPGFPLDEWDRRGEVYAQAKDDEIEAGRAFMEVIDDGHPG